MQGRDGRRECRLQLPAVSRHLLQQRRASDLGLGHRLGAPARVSREGLLIRRREPPPACLARLGRSNQAGQDRGIAFEPTVDRIRARPEPGVVLCRRIVLGAPHQKPGRIAEGFSLVLRERRIVSSGLDRAAVEDERGVVVLLARIQPRQRDERLGISGHEAGGETEQHHCGVFLAALPGREAGVEGAGPEPPAVAVDVLLARRCQR